MENNTKQVQAIKEENYLVTKAVDTDSLSQVQKISDLELLSKAEEKSNYKTNIAKGIKNPKIEAAVSALRLSNPFKGY